MTTQKPQESTPSHSLEVPNLDKTFREILSIPAWKDLEKIFATCSRIIIFGNGGNLAVADHAAVDISRLTDKLGLCPGSGILASSLINDAGHDYWLEKWVKISSRGLPSTVLQNSLFIGISSSGKSENVVRALNYASSIGGVAWMLTARPISSSQELNFKICTLDLDQYHTAEVITLLLTYQLIHSSGFTCPPISLATQPDAESLDFKK